MKTFNLNITVAVKDENTADAMLAEMVSAIEMEEPNSEILSMGAKEVGWHNNTRTQ